VAVKINIIKRENVVSILKGKLGLRAKNTSRKREMSKYLTTSPSSSSSASALKCLPRCKFNKDKKLLVPRLFWG